MPLLGTSSVEPAESTASAKQWHTYGLLADLQLRTLEYRVSTRRKSPSCSSPRPLQVTPAPHGSYHGWAGRLRRKLLVFTHITVPQGQATIAQQFTTGTSGSPISPKSPVGTVENRALRFNRPHGTDMSFGTPSSAAINRWAIVKRPHGSKSSRFSRHRNREHKKSCVPFVIPPFFI